MSDEDTRSPARQQAAATRSATSPAVQLMSRPGSPLLQAIAPDSRYGPAGNARLLSGYDANLAPPALPEGARGEAMQLLSIEELCHVVADHRRDLHYKQRQMIVGGTQVLLGVLERYPGETWEQRWLASGYDAAPRSWFLHDALPHHDRWSPTLMAVNALIQVRVFRPSYSWILDSKQRVNLRRFLQRNGGPDVDRLRELPAYQGTVPKYQADAEKALTRVMMRTGKDIGQICGDDLLFYADVVRTSGRQRREHLLWELLVALGPLAGEAPTLRATWSARGNSRQHNAATLVDRYGIPASGVRNLLVDYLEEIKPGMDYSSLEGLAYRLARLFWWEILQINPDQADLSLAADVVAAWRERLALTTNGRPRREQHSILFAIRGMYRDLAEWSHDDPVRWGVWVAPCPVPRSLSRAAAKEKRRQKATMQDRTRMLTPLLPALISTVAAQKDRTTTFLQAALACAHDEQFVVEGVTFLRHSPPLRRDGDAPARIWAVLAPGQQQPVWIRGTAQRIDVTAVEEEGFWGWAVVETLRHTGIRIEELLELTQLSLRHYTAASTSTLVPLLHVVPSKTDCERLIPMTPELVQVLLEVLRRAKAGQDRVPLSIAYDTNDKVHSQPFPHLFARPLGTRHEVLGRNYVRQILIHIAQVAGLTDAGVPVHFTPHDFRRLFATDAVNNGLPLHIAAALLGHLNLDTTRGYTAVFPEHIVTAHQAYIERRRHLRPFEEGRVADGDEWADFEQHFLLRRVALGECHRPYGTPCVHEHACTRCRFLRVDPAQLGRITEMTENVEERLVEAKDRAWLGEVAALEESLKHLRIRQSEAQQRLSHNTNPFAGQRPQ
ncbi:site-specific recombinase XerD (plasmid) [Mycolicibacterium chubuense NBB4]|uniref:Site-specific recombinase XerD n=1 Tax=Mycolicibacterium chubuense (strain NBB4) TaxID=710421 RepID=I4BSP6_MYCCN|nr:site-specific integrase [Mycolicibacterium chubuense]AFM20303.1 site-specific recombinase XerD [Mycolicibacterium chubuense NBB4]